MNVEERKPNILVLKYFEPKYIPLTAIIPINYFCLFFTRLLFKTFMRETNRFVKSIRNHIHFTIK